MVNRCICMLMVLSLATGNSALADGARRVLAVPEIEALEPELEGLYRDLHEHPELAFHEERTASALAERLRALDFEVTTGVGQTGLVAIFRNGSGTVVMLRTELDALPIEEKTGLPSEEGAAQAAPLFCVPNMFESLGVQVPCPTWSR